MANFWKALTLGASASAVTIGGGIAVAVFVFDDSKSVSSPGSSTVRIEGAAPGDSKTGTAGRTGVGRTTHVSLTPDNGGSGFGTGRGVLNEYEPVSVMMAPLAVSLGGLGGGTGGPARILPISIELTVKGSQGRDLACRLMPRLIAAANGELTAWLQRNPKSWKKIAEGAVDATLRQRMNQALEGDTISKVSVGSAKRKVSALTGHCPR